MNTLRFLRKSLSLTQKYMASILGITQGAYSAIELGRNELTDRNAEILSNKLSINKDWLLTGLGDMRAGQEDTGIDEEIAEISQELFKKGESIGGGSVPYEFVQQLFREREKHDEIIASLQKTIEEQRKMLEQITKQLNELRKK